MLKIALTTKHAINPSFKNNVGKGEKAGNQHFFLYLQHFLPYAFNLVQSRMLLFGHKELKAFAVDNLNEAKAIGGDLTL